MTPSNPKKIVIPRAQWQKPVAKVKGGGARIHGIIIKWQENTIENDKEAQENHHIYNQRNPLLPASTCPSQTHDSPPADVTAQTVEARADHARKGPRLNS